MIRPLHYSNWKHYLSHSSDINVSYLSYKTAALHLYGIQCLARDHSADRAEIGFLQRWMVTMMMMIMGCAIYEKLMS